MTAARLQRATLAETAHRPWPLPERPWLQGQSWLELLFAHWSVPAEALERVMPPQLAPDVREGHAWIGVTPFRVEGLRVHGLPPAPLVSSFCELNVRTYVTANGKPGIYFLSLDADSRAAVTAARRAYRLPYFRARMEAMSDAGQVRYRSERIARDGPPAAFRGVYRAAGPPLEVVEGSLERWLTERYCLYVVDRRGRILRADIHHLPWEIREADVRIEHNTLPPNGIELPAEAPLCHVAERQDVVIWPLSEVGPERKRASRPASTGLKS
jgi:uncharacterized protein YqjF (DUF2071 family)